MGYLNFVLDGTVLIALSELEGTKLNLFKNRIEESNSELFVTHIHVDQLISSNEKVRVLKYQNKVKSALISLADKEIMVRINSAMITLSSQSKSCYAWVDNRELDNLFQEIQKELFICKKIENITKPLLEIAFKAAIAVSSLGHDFFVTCDSHLLYSWSKVMEKNRTFVQYKLPELIHTKCDPKEIAKQIFKLPIDVMLSRVYSPCNFN